MKSPIKNALLMTSLVVVLAGVGYACAANAQIMQGLQTAANTAGLPGKPTGGFEQAIGYIIGSLMGIVGSIMFVYMLYGGFRWMIAGGDSKAVGQAQDIIKNAIIGLAVIVFAYALANFVFTKLSSVASTPTSSGGTTTTTEKQCGSGDAEGFSCVDSTQQSSCSITLDTSVYKGCSDKQVCCKK